MQNVDVDDLLKFAQTLDGKTISTSARSKPFTLGASSEGLEYTPHSTNQMRKHQRKWLERVCQHFSQTNSFEPSNYKKLSAHASYALEVIRLYLLPIEAQLPLIAEEVLPSEEYAEGALTQILVNSFERNAKARAKCIEINGLCCCICTFNFEAEYGQPGKDLIHVHHLKPLSTVKSGYIVDPKEDLKPVCPNCHAIIHRKTPPYTIEEVQAMLNHPS